MLDRIKMPVFAAIRPGAREGSLCVSSGKSMNSEEARTGALCEAIELAAAEYNPERDYLFTSRLIDFEKKSGLDAYDFPVSLEWVGKIPPDAEIKLVHVQEYFTGRIFEIPATLIFLPCPDATGFNFWGQSSNGLSGGNNTEEALLHAILEVMERDTLSLSRVIKNEHRVTEIISDSFIALKNMIESAGLEIEVTSCENEFGLPMFIAYLLDHDYWEGVCIARGQGMHPVREIALMRAATEAVQSRLTNIHGGRDDIVRRFVHFMSMGEKKLAEKFDSFRLKIKNLPTVPFSVIPERFTQPEPGGLLKALTGELYKNGFRQVFYYRFTEKEEPYQVLKVVIPNMEFYDPSHMPRVCKRLIHAVSRS